MASARPRSISRRRTTCALCSSPTARRASSLRFSHYTNGTKWRKRQLSAALPIADIVVEPNYWSRGLGKWMMECIVTHPAIKDAQMVLQTRDAHRLYEKYGFTKNPALMSTQV